jgi:hypothetical protein
MSQVINKAIPSVKPKNSIFSHRFSKSLTCYIKKKNLLFNKYKESVYDYCYSISFMLSELVKFPVKADGLDCS